MKPASLALLLPALLLGAACSAGSTSSSSSEPVADAEPAVGALAPPQTVRGDAAYRDEAGAAGSTGPAQTRAVISRGQVTLETDDLEATRFELQKLLDGWDGSISSEESTSDERGAPERQRLVVRVPEQHFARAVDAISGLGRLVERSRSSEDVSTQVIDTASRVRSQRLSLSRVQALLADAQNLDQVITIEAQLSQRQAELDSLLQQQKYLADQAAEATINVYLTTPAAARSGDGDDEGFRAGLAAGWDGLRDATTALAEAIGAALPFAVVGTVLGFPLWLLWRRRGALT